jgi:hypothetical protein
MKASAASSAATVSAPARVARSAGSGAARSSSWKSQLREGEEEEEGGRGWFNRVYLFIVCCLSFQARRQRARRPLLDAKPHPPKPSPNAPRRRKHAPKGQEGGDPEQVARELGAEDARGERPPLEVYYRLDGGEPPGLKRRAARVPAAQDRLDEPLGVGARRAADGHDVRLDDDVARGRRRGGAAACGAAAPAPPARRRARAPPELAPPLGLPLARAARRAAREHRLDAKGRQRDVGALAELSQLDDAVALERAERVVGVAREERAGVPALELAGGAAAAAAAARGGLLVALRGDGVPRRLLLLLVEPQQGLALVARHRGEVEQPVFFLFFFRYFGRFT